MLICMQDASIVIKLRKSRPTLLCFIVYGDYGSKAARQRHERSWLLTSHVQFLPECQPLLFKNAVNGEATLHLLHNTTCSVQTWKLSLLRSNAVQE